MPGHHSDRSLGSLLRWWHCSIGEDWESLGSLVVVFYAGGTARLGKVGGSQVLPGLPPSVLWESWELSPDDELWANRRRQGRQHHPAAIRKGARDRSTTVARPTLLRWVPVVVSGRCWRSCDGTATGRDRGSREGAQRASAVPAGPAGGPAVVASWCTGAAYRAAGSPGRSPSPRSGGAGGGSGNGGASGGSVAATGGRYGWPGPQHAG